MNSVIHAFEVFRITDTILKDTLVMEKLDLQLILLNKPIDTTCEQLVDDLATIIKHVVWGD